MIDVTVERPVKININGTKLKLSNEEAKILARKLCEVLGMSSYPYYPYSTWTYCTSPNDTKDYTDVTYTIGTSAAYSSSGISVEMT